MVGENKSISKWCELGRKTLKKHFQWDLTIRNRLSKYNKFKHHTYIKKNYNLLVCFLLRFGLFFVFTLLLFFLVEGMIFFFSKKGVHLAHLEGSHLNTITFSSCYLLFSHLDYYFNKVGPVPNMHLFLFSKNLNGFYSRNH